MSAFQLPLNPQIASSSRLRTWISTKDAVSVSEYTTLIMAGVTAAAASGLLDFSLRIPGHAILRCILPMTLGLALVPRYGAGTVMATSAFISGCALRMLGATGGLSVGAFTSLLVCGPLLDLLLKRAHSSIQVVIRCALAGLLSNILALLARGGAKLIGLEALGKGAFSVWFGRAAISYPVCGLLAGLLSALIWFSLRTETRQDNGSDRN